MLADLTGTGRSQVGGGLGPLEPELSGTLTTLPSENHSWTASKALEFVSRKSRWHWWISPPLTVHRKGCKELNDSLQTCDGLKYPISDPCPETVLTLPLVWRGHFTGAHKGLQGEHTPCTAAIHGDHSSWLLMGDKEPCQQYRAHYGDRDGV